MSSKKRKCRPWIRPVRLRKNRAISSQTGRFCQVNLLKIVQTGARKGSVSADAAPLRAPSRSSENPLRSRCRAWFVAFPATFLSNLPPIQPSAYLPRQNCIPCLEKSNAVWDVPLHRDRARGGMPPPWQRLTTTSGWNQWTNGILLDGRCKYVCPENPPPTRPRGSRAPAFHPTPAYPHPMGHSTPPLAMAPGQSDRPRSGSGSCSGLMLQGFPRNCIRDLNGILCVSPAPIHIHIAGLSSLYPQACPRRVPA